jgi:hypothetical protein
MLNRPCRSSLAAHLPLLTVILSSLAFAGCGDNLSDDAYGFIDLAPYYYDGSSATNPSAGLAREIAPTKGWMSGVRAEYYDFGLVGFVKKRTDGKLPDYASVPAMYFFFDTAGNPLFSQPIYEKRTGLWLMKGGLNTLDPNPRDDAPRDVPYSVRVRNLLVDPARQSADYQRPIVDRLQHNTDYSGLWEIWEVTAPDDYVPDSIKQWSTLSKALDSGGAWAVRRTQKVINCPVLDDRQTVTPTALWYGIPHPRIELWYRTKQGSCFLSDGWLALGGFDRKLIPANHDNARLNMFDVISYTIGDATTGRTTVLAPVTKMYIPKVTVANQDPTKGASDIRYTGDNVTDTMPRYRPSDPPGYSPLRWLWDLKVPQDPPYTPGSYKRLDQMDPANLSNRLTANTPFVKNFPLIGVITRCANDGDCSKVAAAPGLEGKLQCNKNPFDTKIPLGDVAVSDPPAGFTTDQLINDREGGARCDVPAGGFGDFCAPGVGRCAFDIKGTPDETPTLNGVQLTTDGKAPDPMGKNLVKLLGYTCQPIGTGYCMFRCDTDAGTAGAAPPGVTAALPIEYKGPGTTGTVKKDMATLSFESRCGNIPGYKCLNPSPTTPPVPSRLRVCLRSCDTAKPDPFNDAYCTNAAKVKVGGRREDNIQKGMSCSNRGIDSAAGCQWDPAFEPRDPLTNYTP